MPAKLAQLPARILIADDSSVFRTLLRKAIEAYSTHWKVCGEAAEGLDVVQKAMDLKPDVVIIDLQMPAMDGLTASSRIAKSLPALPILICTIHTSGYLDGEARRFGIRKVISKSNMAGLLKSLEEVLGARA